MINAINGKLMGKIILTGEKLQAFPEKTVNQSRVSTYTIPVQYSVWSPGQNNKTREENKRVTNRKGMLKINIHKSIAFLYYQRQTEKKIRETF